jgi:hypothetical protein
VPARRFDPQMAFVQAARAIGASDIRICRQSGRARRQRHRLRVAARLGRADRGILAAFSSSAPSRRRRPGYRCSHLMEYWSAWWMSVFPGLAISSRPGTELLRRRVREVMECALSTDCRPAAQPRSTGSQRSGCTEAVPDLSVSRRITRSSVRWAPPAAIRHQTLSFRSRSAGRRAWWACRGSRTSICSRRGPRRRRERGGPGIRCAPGVAPRAHPAGQSSTADPHSRLAQRRGRPGRR